MHRATRTGFTLLEVLLVLAIMVVAVGLAIPSYKSLVEGRRLQASAEKLQVALNRGRVTALRSGQTQMLRLELGTGRYAIEPWLSQEDAVESGPGAVVQMGGQAMATSPLSGQLGQLADPQAGQAELEQGIVVAAVQTQLDTRDLASAGEGMGLSGALGWSDPVMLYADGSSTTVQIILQDSSGRRFAVRLRGVTGQASIQRLSNAS
jgi:prepilin-type N-terminal cleavage/methylation domain-containing protein